VCIVGRMVTSPYVIRVHSFPGLSVAKSTEQRTLQKVLDIMKVHKRSLLGPLISQMDQFHTLKILFFNMLPNLNSRVQHPVARVSIGFINVTTVRNYFLLLYY
jgi:hypothetical protein